MSKDFDAVGFMRKRRAKIDDEDRGLSWEEKARKTVDLLRDDPLWKRLKSRVVQPGSGFGAGKVAPPQKRKSAATRRRSR